MAVSEGITVERERCHRWQEGRADYRSKEGQPLEEERKHGEAEVLQEDGTNRTAARRRGEERKRTGRGEAGRLVSIYIYIGFTSCGPTYMDFLHLLDRIFETVIF